MGFLNMDCSYCGCMQVLVLSKYHIECLRFGALLPTDRHTRTYYDAVLLSQKSQQEEHSGASMQFMQHANVCRECYQTYPQKQKLCTSKCLYPEQHKSSTKITVLWNQNKQTLVHIRPMPPILLQRRHGKYILCDRFRCRGELFCTHAHSEEEMHIWNKQLKVHRLNLSRGELMKMNLALFYIRYPVLFSNSVSTTSVSKYEYTSKIYFK